MIKSIAICNKCKKQTLSFEETGGVIVFDFIKMEISFTCAKCGYNNILNLGNLESLLTQRTKLPRIGGAR